MARYTIVKFKNMSPLHIGAGRSEYDTASPYLYSDTISGALASLYAQLKGGGGVQEFLDRFAVSSAFPYSGNAYYLPKPAGRLAFNGIDADLVRKKAKKIKFIEHSIWNQVVAGQQPAISQEQFNGEFLVSAQDAGSFKMPYTTAVHQRVAVSRDGMSDAVPFFFEWKFFAKDAGLCCIIDAEPAVMEELKSLFIELGERGLGSDRSVGGGMFDVEFSTIELPDVENADSILLLSQYIPCEEELKEIHLEDSRYELSQRDGYMSGSSVTELRHLLKKPVYMFNTASVLKISICPRGCVVNVAPEWNNEKMHPVYRSGRSLALPIKTVDYE